MTQSMYSNPLPTTSQLPKRKAGSRFTSGHILMIVAAILAFLLSTIILRGGKSETIVYIAKQEIIEGQRLSINQFDAKSIPSSELDALYVSQGELTEDKTYFASRTIKEGEPLLDSARTPEAEKTGTRLISIPVDKSHAVNGSLSRGDRIDVIETSEDAGCAFRALSNLEVVSTPSSGGGGGALGGGSNVFVVTVAIANPSDDLTLAGIISRGSFQVVKTTGVTTGKFIEDPICGNATQVPGYGSDEGGNG